MYELVLYAMALVCAIVAVSIITAPSIAERAGNARERTLDAAVADKRAHVNGRIIVTASGDSPYFLLQYASNVNDVNEKSKVATIGGGHAQPYDELSVEGNGYVLLQGL